MKKKQLSIHIGAHKTATTHLQQTLKKLIYELECLDITYIPLDVLRPRLISLYPSGFKGRLFNKLPKTVFSFFAKNYLFKNIKLKEKILLSEENIIGSSLGLMDAMPYRDFDQKLNFISLLSTQYDLKLFLSIRSFDKVLPGAYITGLRFNPIAAIKAKDKLLEQLVQKNYPSWYELIERLLVRFENINLQVWTQESYRNHSDEIIRFLLGEEITDIPQIPPPIDTKTPSIAAVEKIENIVMSISEVPDNWMSICDEVYKSLQPTNSSEKYTFLNDTMINDLQESYKNDLRKIQSVYPGMIIDIAT
jgi:hypothetical protein